MGSLRLPCKQLLVTLKNVAELFADTHASVFLDNDPVRPVPYQIYGRRMPALNITAEKAYAALQCLNVSSAVCPNNFHLRVLKTCALQ